MVKAKTITVINYVLSGILWLLGLLTLLFNVLGLWVPWHLAGFGFMFYIHIPAISQVLALFACYGAEKKFLRLNLFSLGISVGFVLLTLFVSTSWFW